MPGLGMNSLDLSHNLTGFLQNFAVTFKLYDRDRNGILDSSVSCGIHVLVKGICSSACALTPGLAQGLQKQRKGWECSSVAKCLPSIQKNLNLSPTLPSPQKQTKQNQKKEEETVVSRRYLVC